MYGKQQTKPVREVKLEIQVIVYYQVDLLYTKVMLITICDYGNNVQFQRKKDTQNVIEMASFVPF